MFTILWSKWPWLKQSIFEAKASGDRTGKLLELMETELKLTAANGCVASYIGCVELTFTLCSDGIGHFTKGRGGGGRERGVKLNLQICTNV